MPDSRRVVELLIRAKNELAPGLRAAAQDMAQLQSAARALGTGMVALGSAGLAGLSSMVATTVQAQAAMFDLSKRTQTSTVDLSLWKEVLQQSGSDIGTLGTAMRFLQRSMVGLSEDGQDTSGIFAQLGVNVRNARGEMRPAIEVFGEVRQRISEIQDPATRTAFALQLFGRGAQGLNEVLALSEEQVRAFKQQAVDLGHVIRDEDAAAADALDDSLTSLKESVAGLTRQIATELIPKLTPVVERMQELLKTSLEWAKANPGLAESILKVSVALVGAGGLLIAVGSLSTAAAAATPVLAAFWAAVTGPVGATVLAASALAALGLKITDMAKQVQSRTLGSTGPSTIVGAIPGLTAGTGAQPTAAVPPIPTRPTTSRSRSETDRLEFWQLTPAEKRIRLAEDERLMSEHINAALEGMRPTLQLRQGRRERGPDLGPGGFQAVDPTTQFSKTAELVARLRSELPGLAQTGVAALVQLGQVAGTTLVQNFRNLGEAVKQWGQQALAAIAGVIAQTLILRGLTAIIPGAGSALRFLGFSQGGVVPAEAARGGIVYGGVPGRDSVPVLAQAGEGFLSRADMSKLDQLLRQGGAGKQVHIHVHSQAFLGDVGQAMGFAQLTKQLLREHDTGSRL